MHDTLAKQMAVAGAMSERPSSQIVRPLYLDNLRDQRDSLETRLANVNKLIEALENNKQFVEILDLMGKV